MSIKRFMVVDTVSETAMQLKGLLGEMRIQDITVSLAADDAISLLEPKRIEFIIVNWDLKGMTGAAFIQRVRDTPEGGFIPFLIYTDRLKADERKLLEDLGITNVVPFPLDRAKVMSQIKSMSEAENSIDPNTRTVQQAAHFISLEKYEEALSAITPVVDVAEVAGIANTVKGDVELRLNKLAEAEASIQKAMSANPDNKKAKQLLARVYSSTGRTKEAIGLLQELADQSPLNISNLLALGGVFLGADRHAEAKETLDKVSDIDPANPAVKDLRGTIAFKEGDYALAKELLQNTPNGDDMVRSLNNIAIGLVSRGDIERGIQSYRAAIEMLSGKDLTHILLYNLALAYKKSSQWELALKTMGSSLQENAQYEKAQKAFVKLLHDMKKINVSYDTDYVQSITGLFKKSA